MLAVVEAVSNDRMVQCKAAQQRRPDSMVGRRVMCDLIVPSCNMFMVPPYESIQRGGIVPTILPC